MYWFPDLSATAKPLIAGMPETKINLKDDPDFAAASFYLGLIGKV